MELYLKAWSGARKRTCFDSVEVGVDEGLEEIIPARRVDAYIVNGPSQNKKWLAVQVKTFRIVCNFRH